MASKLRDDGIYMLRKSIDLESVQRKSTYIIRSEIYPLRLDGSKGSGFETAFKEERRGEESISSTISLDSSSTIGEEGRLCRHRFSWQDPEEQLSGQRNRCCE